MNKQPDAINAIHEFLCRAGLGRADVILVEHPHYDARVSLEARHLWDLLQYVEHMGGYDVHTR